MQLHLPKTGSEIYLDGLILECIFSNFRARDLATISGVCRALRSPSQLAAYRSLVLMVQRMQCSLLRHCERGSWIHQLREWEAFQIANVMWLQATEEQCVVVKQGELKLVKCAKDMSGNSNRALNGQRMPVLRPDSVNGHAAFEFDGASVLKTRPFSQPLPQPVTLMVVARARGDTTIVDSLGPQSGRFELCHGYPSGWHPSPEICMSASGEDSAPKQSLRGSTRGTGDWHIYTAIFDNKKSEIFVDGYCEASGKTAGPNSLDGLSIGCDHNGVFFLTGSIAELRLFSCHMPTAQRVQTEAALAHRYGLEYSSVPAPPAKSGHSLSRFSCVPRAPPARTSHAVSQ